MFILSYIDSLLFLICAYQNNRELLSKGPYRGHDGELISHYRRECLLVSEHNVFALALCWTVSSSHISNLL